MISSADKAIAWLTALAMLIYFLFAGLNEYRAWREATANNAH